MAPYVDFTNWPMPDLMAWRAATGISTYNLGFITNTGTCKPAWGGYAALAPNQTGEQIDNLNKQIADLQAAGGKIQVSFGGAAGDELATKCSTVAALKAAYKSVIDQYKLTRVDFDIEGGALSNSAANTRRSQAIASLQADAAAAGKTLTVTYTIPVMPYGLDADGLAGMHQTYDGGARVDIVNLMTMDYGVGTNTHMGQSAIDAATNAATNLAFMWPGSTPAQRIAHLGITPLIGEADFPGETFTLTNAQEVTTWAKANNLAEIAWWSMSRDTPCPNNEKKLDDPFCSGTSNSTWAYANAFKARWGGSSPTPTPTPTGTPTPTPTATSSEIRKQAFVTGYSYWDNTPPGSATISHPVIHQVAAGTGTYADPITVAVGHTKTGSQDILDFPAGTRFYVPNLRRYFIVEDSCGDGATPQNGPCHTGYPSGAAYWIDVWVGGGGQSSDASDSCMNAITDIHLVIQNPANNYKVVPGEITANCSQYGETILTN